MIIILIGLFAGIISGMGIGGGMILIPALRLFTDVTQKASQCVNLFYFIPTAVSALFIHIKNKNVSFKILLPLLLCGVAFSFLGSFLAVRIGENFLGKLFAAFILIAGIRELWTTKRI